MEGSARGPSPTFPGLGKEGGTGEEWMEGGRREGLAWKCLGSVTPAPAEDPGGSSPPWAHLAFEGPAPSADLWLRVLLATQEDRRGSCSRPRPPASPRGNASPGSAGHRGPTALPQELLAGTAERLKVTPFRAAGPEPSRVIFFIKKQNLNQENKVIKFLLGTAGPTKTGSARLTGCSDPRPLCRKTSESLTQTGSSWFSPNVRVGMGSPGPGLQTQTGAQLGGLFGSSRSLSGGTPGLGPGRGRPGCA